MKQHAFRLRYGQDLKMELQAYAKAHKIQAGVVLSGVGCLYEAKIRKADGVSIHEEINHFEIVSLQGTISEHGCHLHIALSDASMATIGGHLLNGCLVNTTVEVVILELNQLRFHRNFDKETGFPELIITSTPE